MTVVVFVAQIYPRKKLSMVLVINCDAHANDGDILKAVKGHCKNYTVKSKCLTASKLDYVIEINITTENNLLRELMNIDGVNTASILSHDGEITAS